MQTQAAEINEAEETVITVDRNRRATVTVGRLPPFTLTAAELSAFMDGEDELGRMLREARSRRRDTLHSAGSIG